MHAPSLLRLLAVLAFSAPALNAGHARAQQPAPSPEGDPTQRSEETELTPELAYQRATSYYEAGRYPDCTEALAGLLRDGSPNRPRAPELVERARVYYAACLMAVGKPAEADEQFRAAIRENPQIGVPSSVVFPQPVVDRFLVVRQAMREEIQKAEAERVREEQQQQEQERRKSEAERQRMRELERLAQQETLISKNERWIATVPFGVGQFQNRDYVLGSVFLGLELGLVATAITATAIQLSLHEQAQGGGKFTSDEEAAQATQNLKTANTVALAATGGFLFTAILGVVEAHLAFEPEYAEGKRQRRPGVLRINQKAALDPVVAPGRDGAVFGVRGAF